MANRPYCKGCRYYRWISSTRKADGHGCHYMLDTSEQRSCPIEECGKNKVHYDADVTLSEKRSIGFRLEGSSPNRKEKRIMEGKQL